MSWQMTLDLFVVLLSASKESLAHWTLKALTRLDEVFPDDELGSAMCQFANFKGKSSSIWPKARKVCNIAGIQSQTSAPLHHFS
jgi:hypothetical protein